MNFHHRTKNVSNVFHNKSRPKRNDEKKQSGFAFSNGDGKDEDGSSCTCHERTELLRIDDSSAVSTRNIRQMRSHANTLQTQSKEEYQSEDIKRSKLPIEM